MGREPPAATREKRQMSDATDSAELEILRTQIGVYRDRLSALEARIGLGEKITTRQGRRLTAVEKTSKKQGKRLDEHEDAIVDIYRARIMFAGVVEDMQRELHALSVPKENTP